MKENLKGGVNPNGIFSRTGRLDLRINLSKESVKLLESRLLRQKNRVQPNVRISFLSNMLQQFKIVSRVSLRRFYSSLIAQKDI